MLSRGPPPSGSIPSSLPNSLPGAQPLGFSRELTPLSGLNSISYHPPRAPHPSSPSEVLVSAASVFSPLLRVFCEPLKSPSRNSKVPPPVPASASLGTHQAIRRAVRKNQVRLPSHRRAPWINLPHKLFSAPRLLPLSSLCPAGPSSHLLAWALISLSGSLPSLPLYQSTGERSPRLPLKDVTSTLLSSRNQLHLFLLDFHKTRDLFR